MELCWLISELQVVLQGFEDNRPSETAIFFIQHVAVFLIYDKNCDKNVSICDEIMLAWKKKKLRRSLKTGHEWFIQSKRAMKVVLTYGYVFKEKYICTMRLRAYNISELHYSEMTDETAEDAPPAGLVAAS